MAPTRTESGITVESLLKENSRSYAWLSRQTGIPYKRVLAEAKHGDILKAPAEHVISYAQALGVDELALMGRA